MIFVTVGSQKFQFNRLLNKIDELIENKVIQEEVYAQIGVSDYSPKNYTYERFMDKENFYQKLLDCDILITHGGTGTIVNAVKNGKRVIAVPRLAEFGEHVDDHQLQLINQFSEHYNYIVGCNDIDKLGEQISSIKDMDFQSYKSNTNRYIEELTNYIEEL